MFDWLIVGAGFTGAVAAERLATECGQRVLVIDSRDHIAGNAFDTRNEDGILYHAYGPHIFHTNSEQVTSYLSRFTDWRPYEHRVVALVRNRFVPVPFSFTSIDILFNRAKAARLKEALVERYGFGTSTTILKLRCEQSEVLRELADFIYENVFLGYTRKQWALEPEELSASVTDRVPVRVSYDDRYFQDSFQKMPLAGYTAMFERILDNPNIQVELNTNWKDVKGTARRKNVLFTGAIDEYYDYRFGALPYRSLAFDMQLYRQLLHQPTAQVNYPNAEAFTRITEMSHLTGESHERCLVAIEYPHAHQPGENIPYYPIPRAENEDLHKKYLGIEGCEPSGVFFAGRLADYRYYNMDQAVGRALSFVKKTRSDLG